MANVRSQIKHTESTFTEINRNTGKSRTSNEAIQNDLEGFSHAIHGIELSAETIAESAEGLQTMLGEK
ncbi:hypothetical protein CHI07_10870 [Paenibacillus sp. 7884-2]|nr:hypothetical protein CHI07_10870 [Paenibacillus sp. 7884-2]